MEKDGNKPDGRYFKKVRAINLVQAFRSYLKTSFKKAYGETEEQKWKMFALLFVRPNTQLAKNAVIPILDYLYYHSGEFIDFYCVGYHEIEDKENQNEIVTVGDSKWGYSNLDFNKLRQFFQNETKWKYSGRSDMILANYTFHKNNMYIDYANAIALSLESAIECKAINSAEEFLTSIAEFASQNKKEDPTLKFFLNQYQNLGKKAIWNMVLSCIPEPLRNTPKQLETFMLEDLRKLN